MPLWNPLCSRTKFQLIHLQGNGNKHAWDWKGKNEEEMNNASISHLCFLCCSCLDTRECSQTAVHYSVVSITEGFVFLDCNLFIDCVEPTLARFDLFAVLLTISGLFLADFFIRPPPRLQILLCRFPEFYLFPLFHFHPSNPNLQHRHEALLHLPNKHYAEIPDTNFSSGFVSCFR